MITWMQTHRKYLVPTIWISTLAFVGAGFVGWGAYDYGNNKSNTVAQVGDREISVSEFQSTYSNIYGYYNQLFGGKLTQEKASQMHLEDIAMQKVTNEGLLLNYADELGIQALDKEVIDLYTSIEAFQDKGVFSKAQYEQVLRSQSLDRKLFEKNLEKSIILKKLFEALKLPSTPLENRVTFSAKTLADHLIFKKLSQDPKEVSIDEASIKKAWEAEKNSYMSQRAYTLETIKVPSGDIAVDDKALSEYYAEKKYQFKDKEGKILPLENAKEEVTKALQLKKAKTAILKKYLAFKKGTIKAQEEITVDATSRTFPISLLKDLKEGAYLKAVPLAEGYMTARIKKIEAPKPLSYEKAKPLVETKLRQQKATELLTQKAIKAEKSLSDGTDAGFVTLEDSAKLKDLSQAEASQFLQHIFSKDSKKGHFIIQDTALVYQIKGQKLFDKARFDTESNKTAQDFSSIKKSLVESGLIESLKKKYEVQIFTKREG